MSANDNLLESINNSNVDGVNKALKEGANPDYICKYNRNFDSVMMLAIKTKNIEIIERLLEENINLKKFVFTNGSKEHVKNITTQLGIDDQFDGVFDIEDAEYSPKPEPKAFDLMVDKFKIDPTETLYIEDIAKNLSIGKERGAKTVWLINDEYWGKKESDEEYIDYKIENLSLFLKEIRLLKNS